MRGVVGTGVSRPVRTDQTGSHDESCRRSIAGQAPEKPLSKRASFLAPYNGDPPGKISCDSKARGATMPMCDHPRMS